MTIKAFLLSIEYVLLPMLWISSAQLGQAQRINHNETVVLTSHSAQRHTIQSQAVATASSDPAAASTSALDSEEWAFLTLINNYRAQNGAGPLQVSAALANASHWMSSDMAANNYVSHTDSMGRDAHTRQMAFGYGYYPWGENIAAGFADAQSAFTGWVNACDPDSSGKCTYAHRQNMLDSSFAVIGIGRAYGTGSSYGWYWTTDFGGVVDATISPLPSTPAPIISSFTATPSTISTGQSATLSWNVSGASSVSIDNGIGDVSTVTAKSVAPAQTTTYTLTATSSGGSVTASASVTVAGTPSAGGGPLVLPSSVTVAPGQTVPYSVTMPAGAPPGGVFLTLASSDPSKVAVSGSVYIPQGATTTRVPITITGISLGSAAITAAAYGFPSATGQVQVTSGGVTQSAVINVPATATVTLGQSTTFPINLSSPAAAGGVTVTLTSSDVSKVIVTSSVYIAGGATAPSTQPQVSGISPGSANITASASGYTPGTGQVQTAATTPSGGSSSFSPASLSINVGSAGNLVLNLSAPAPASGVTATLNSSNTGVATVPHAVVFGAFATSANVSVSGVALGSASITATTPNFGNASANVTVSGSSSQSGIMVPGSVTVAPGNTINFPVTLGTAAPGGGMFLTMTSSDSSKVTVSPASVYIGEGTTAPRVTITVTGISAGGATITASAYGYPSATGQVQVGSGGTGGVGGPTAMSFLGSPLNITRGSTGNLTLNLAGGQAPAGGLAVNLSSSDVSKATVPFTVNIAGGAASANVQVLGVGAGSATITASAAGIANATATVNVSNLQTITVPPTTGVGLGGSVSFAVVLSASSPSPITVSLSSTDSTKVSVSPSSITIPGGATTPSVQPQVTGTGVGSALITASVAGYISASGTVTVGAPTLTYSGQPLSIGVGSTGNFTLTLSGGVAPAGGFMVNLSSSDPSKATVPPTANFAAGALNLNVPVTGAAAGSATITAASPSFGTVTVNVTVSSSQSGIIVPANVTLAPGATANFPVVLGAGAPAGGIFITLASTDTSKVSVSPSSVYISPGMTQPLVPTALNGISAGSATVMALSYGYPPGTAAVQVVGSGGTISFSPGSLTIPGATTQNLTLLLSSPLAGGLTVTLSSSNAGVATVPATVSFGPNATTATVPVTSLAAGSATITASAAGMPSASASVLVTQSAIINIPSTAMVGLGQSATFQVSLSAPAPAGGVTVQLTSSDVTKVIVTTAIFIAGGATAPATQTQISGISPGSAIISASAAGYTSSSAQVRVISSGGSSSFSPSSLTITAGVVGNLILNLSGPAPSGGITASLISSNTGVATVPGSVVFAANATSVTVPVTGVAGGSATITAATPQFGSATATLIVSPPSSQQFLVPGSVTLAPGGIANFPVTLATPAPAGGMFFMLTSADPSKVIVSPASVYVPQGMIQSTVATTVTGVSAGSATITVSAFGYPSASGQVLVTTGSAMAFSPANLTISAGSTQNFVLVLSGPAPSGGLTVSLASTNTGVATVPTTVSFGASTTSVAVPVTGITSGSTTITASASGFGSTSASVAVTGSIILPTISTLGIGTSVDFPVSLRTGAPTGGVSVTLTSSNPSLLTITPSTLFFSQGATTASVTPKISGINYGSVTLVASVPGLDSTSQQVQVTMALSVAWHGACWLSGAGAGITGSFQAMDFAMTTATPVPVQGTLFFTANCDASQGADNMNDFNFLTGSIHTATGFSHFPDRIPTSAIFWVGDRTADGMCAPGSPCSGCVNYTKSTPSCDSLP